MGVEALGTILGRDEVGVDIAMGAISGHELRHVESDRNNNDS